MDDTVQLTYRECRERRERRGAGNVGGRKKKQEADRPIKRRMNGWMHGRMDEWMDERRGRVQREKRQQQLRTLAKMREGEGWSFTFWAHDITLFFSILPFSPFFHICRADPFHAHTHIHILKLFGTVCYCRGKRHFSFNKEALVYFSPSPSHPVCG